MPRTIFTSIPRWGDGDEDVRILQSLLKADGSDPGSLDGQFGHRTEIAVRDFQSRHGFAVNGTLDEDQLRLLGIQIVISHALSETPWMNWLAQYEGETEISGIQDNQFIMGLYKYGGYKANHDEVPWCACCANAALKITGYKGTDRADAKSFVNCGETCVLSYGAIVVLRHADGSHHVTFFIKWIKSESGLIELFGGNQSNSLIKKTYNVSGNHNGHDEIIAVRWPVKE